MTSSWDSILQQRSAEYIRSLQTRAEIVVRQVESASDTPLRSWVRCADSIWCKADEYEREEKEEMEYIFAFRFVTVVLQVIASHKELKTSGGDIKSSVKELKRKAAHCLDRIEYLQNELESLYQDEFRQVLEEREMERERVRKALAEKKRQEEEARRRQEELARQRASERVAAPVSAGVLAQSLGLGAVPGAVSAGVISLSTSTPAAISSVRSRDFAGALDVSRAGTSKLGKYEPAVTETVSEPDPPPAAAEPAAALHDPAAAPHEAAATQHEAAATQHVESAAAAPALVNGMAAVQFSPAVERKVVPDGGSEAAIVAEKPAEAQHTEQTQPIAQPEGKPAPQAVPTAPIAADGAPAAPGAVEGFEAPSFVVGDGKDESEENEVDQVDDQVYDRISAMMNVSLEERQRQRRELRRSSARTGRLPIPAPKPLPEEPKIDAYSDKNEVQRLKGGRLRTTRVPVALLSEFMRYAAPNTQRDIEFCGILAGKLRRTQFVVTHLLIPKQTCTPNSCDAASEEDILMMQMQEELITLGWIHTHPTQDAFLSSVDLHTHYGYQVMLPEALAIVVAPKSKPGVGVFRIREAGMPVIAACEKRGFHEHNAPRVGVLFENCRHLKWLDNAPVNVVDLRKR